jgi:DNA-binding CsgD family transcriptional regulator
VTTLHDAVDSLVGLSPRQREVVILIVQGLTYLEIGVSLGISTRMAKQHSLEAQEKLGCSKRNDIVRLVWGRIAVSSRSTCPVRPS